MLAISIGWKIVLNLSTFIDIHSNPAYGMTVLTEVWNKARQLFMKEKLKQH